MGKVVKFSGSRLLGEELRRLRGGRTLDDVVELGKAKLLEFGFKSVAKTTLSEIENGRALPNIESVFALSILYQVPTSKFLHILLEENLIEGREVAQPKEDLARLYADALQSRRSTEALALAISAQRQATGGWDQIKWRLNRALAIEGLGMRGDAINELQACLEAPDVPQSQRFRIHRELARMHAEACQFLLADMHLRESVSLASDGASPLDRCRLLQSRIRLRLSRKECGLDPAVVDVDQLDALVSEAMSISEGVTAADRIVLCLYRAAIAHYRGDDRAARRGYKAALMDARAEQLSERQVDALRSLARLDVAYEPEVARKHLREAAEIAVDGSHVDLAFYTFFELFDLAENSDQAAYYLRKCRRLYPLVQSTHPIVKRFEALGARGAE